MSPSCRGLLTAGDQVRKDIDQAGHPGLHQRNLHPRAMPRVRLRSLPKPLSATLGCQQRRQRSHGELQAGEQVEQRDPDLDRWPRRLARDRHQPGHRLREQVVCRTLGALARDSEATDHRHDQLGMSFRQTIRSKPQAIGGRGSGVVHQQVRARGEQVKQLTTAIGPQVDHDRSLVAVDRREIGTDLVSRIAPERRTPAAALVAAWRLELDDVGPQVGQEHGRERPGEHPAAVEHAHAGKGKGRVWHQRSYGRPMASSRAGSMRA